MVSMVIDGREQRQIPKDVFTFVEFEGDRIRLPQRFAEAAQLSGADPVERLLLVRKAGAFRLMPPLEGPALNTLLKILDQWRDAGAGKDPLDKTESDKAAAQRGSLIQCVISPPGPGWRINFPKGAKHLATPGDRSGVFLLIVGGCVELWFPDVYRQALSGPVSERFELVE